MPARNTVIALLIVLAGVGIVVTGSVGFLILLALLAAFYFYWRSPYFSWTPIVVIAVIVLLALIVAYFMLLSYAQGWQY